MGTKRTLSNVVALLFAVQSASSVILPVISNPKPFKNVDMPNIPASVVEEAFASAQTKATNRDKIESQLQDNGGVISNDQNSAEAKHQRLLLVTRESMKMEDNQEKFEGAADYLIRKYRLSPDQVAYGLPRVNLNGGARGRAAVQECQAQFRTNCVDSKFRTADGSCNNKQNTIWGRSNTCFERLIPPKYVDGVSVPRLSVTGGELPNARVISLSLFGDLDVPNKQYTHMTMQWGQFLDHDLTFTPMSRAGSSMMMIECCNTQGEPHPECFPIDLPDDDLFFSEFEESCINFVRSATCSDCKLGPRQQTNQLTGYIDGSNVYGSNTNYTNGLRTFRNGLLKFQNGSSGQLLPQSNDIRNDQCSRPNTPTGQDGLNPGICFLAGDGRVNEQPGLTAMHTLWLRQHNRIATRFKNMIKSASDEAIFQETRRVVGAQIQMITYNEFLPVVLGPDYMNYFHLYPQDTGFTKYQSNTQSSIVHEFSTAAYRFGHTLIQNGFAQSFGNGSTSSLSLRENYFFPFGLYRGEFDPIIRGLFGQPAQQFDRHFAKAITDHLYKQREEPFGMDLTALNIQRGRDHGLNSYIDYLDYCFDIKIRDFSQLTQVMSRENSNKLSRVYGHVADIDLFVGGVMETPLPGGVVGPTFGCIIGLQFFHLKFGDRYFFEHGDQAGQFKTTQLDEIRQKTTLSSVICDNSDDITSLQYRVFATSNKNNRIVECKQLPDIDFKKWL